MNLSVGEEEEEVTAEVLNTEVMNTEEIRIAYQMVVETWVKNDCEDLEVVD